MSCRNHLWQLGHDGIMMVAAATHVLTFRLSSEERYVVSVKPQVGEYVVVDLLHHRRPVGIAVVRTALMEEDTLDDTFLLSQLGHVDQTLVGVTAVVFRCQLGPPLTGIAFQLGLIQVFVEHLYRTAAHGHGHDTDLHIQR